jgi:hypothetical protein
MGAPVMSSESNVKAHGRVPSVFVGFAAGAVALGVAMVWLFSSHSMPRSETSAVAPVGISRSASQVHGAPVAQGSSNHGTNAAEAEAALRGKLAVSVGEFLRALAELGQTQPAMAIDLAQQLGRTDAEKSEWVEISMQQWADRDAQAAWDWLRQLSFTRKNELAGGDLPALVLGTMAGHDPDRVLANLDSLLRAGNLSESVSTPLAVHLGVEALVENGKIDLARQAVETWAKDPAHLNIEAAAFETVASVLAKTQPREAGDWLRSMPISDERNAAMASFVSTWAEQDTRAALQWAEALPANEGQQDAINRTISDWIETRPSEIGDWLSDYLSRAPANDYTDGLIGRVINVSPTVRASPQTALQWLALISDPATRAATAEKVAVRWAAQDHAAAINFVQTSATIPADRKPALVQQIMITPLAPLDE